MVTENYRPGGSVAKLTYGRLRNKDTRLGGVHEGRANESIPQAQLTLGRERR